MAKRRKVQNSFNAGVLSPKLLGRFNIEKYYNGCRVLENFIVWPEGGVFNRPGFYYQAETKTSSSGSRLIPFIYSDTDSYILEFGNLYIRFFRGWGQVLDGGAPYEISSPYSSSDLAGLQFVQDADVLYLVHPDYQQRKLSRTGHTNWTMSLVDAERGPFLPENDTATTITVKSYTIDAVSIANKTFTISDDGDLSSVFADGIKFNVDGSTGNDAEWTVSSTSYSSPDFVITVTGIIADATVDGTVLPDITKDGVIELEASTGIFESTHVGSLWQATYAKEAVSVAKNFTSSTTSDSVPVALDQSLDYVTNGTWTGTMVLEVSRDGGTSWEDVYRFTSASNSNKENVIIEEVDDALYRWNMAAYTSGTCSANLTARSQKVNGTVKIDTFKGTTLVEGTVKSDIVKANTPTKLWSEGAWSDKRGWPVSVAFYEQRAYYGGTSYQPTTLWGSVSLPGGDFDNFLAGTDDDRAITFTMAEAGQDPIKWIVGENGLVVGTSGGTYIMSASSQAESLTPTNVKSTMQDIAGAAALMPIKTSIGLLFVERGGKRVNEFTYSWEADRFVTANMVRLAEHITGSGVKEIAFQKRPERIMWCVTYDGDLIGLTYLRSEQIVCWHWHNTKGSLESVAIKPGKSETENTDEDEVWAIINRTINGSTVRNVERMMPWNWGSDQEDAFFVDSGVTYDGVPTATVSGLDHLEGETVKICADGAPQPDKIVFGGSVTLDTPASAIHVGLGYTSTLKPMHPADGSFSLGSTMRIPRAAITFYRTNGARFGSSVSDMEEVTFRDASDTMDSPVSLFTGTKMISFPGGYEREGDFIIEQDKPLPCNVLSIVLEVESE